MNEWMNGWMVGWMNETLLNDSYEWLDFHSDVIGLVIILYFSCELTPWSRVPLEKPKVIQLVNKFPAFYGTRRFITVFTRACHWSLSWARWIQSTSSHTLSVRSIMILSSHVRLRLQGGYFPSGFPAKIPYTFLISPMRATCPAHSFSLIWSS
jgi:hypothetical protein